MDTLTFLDTRNFTALASPPLLSGNTSPDGPKIFLVKKFAREGRYGESKENCALEKSQACPPEKTAVGESVETKHYGHPNGLIARAPRSATVGPLSNPTQRAFVSAAQSPSALAVHTSSRNFRQCRRRSPPRAACPSGSFVTFSFQAFPRLLA